GLDSTATDVLLEGATSSFDLGVQPALANVQSGGFLFNVIATSGANLTIQGGQAGDVFILSGALLEVSQAGTVSGVTLSGVGSIPGQGPENAIEFLSGGSLSSDTTIDDGGTLQIVGGDAQTVNVSGGGSLFVMSLGTAENVTLSGTPESGVADASIESGG